MIKKTNTAGQGIRQAREALGMSLSDLARGVNRDKSTISLIESGKRNCPPELLKAIKKHFDEQVALRRSKAWEEQQTKTLLQYGFESVSAFLTDSLVGKRRKDTLFDEKNGILKPIPD